MLTSEHVWPRDWGLILFFNSLSCKKISILALTSAGTNDFFCGLWSMCDPLWERQTKKNYHPTLLLEMLQSPEEGFPLRLLHLCLQLQYKNQGLENLPQQRSTPLGLNFYTFCQIDLWGALRVLCFMVCFSANFGGGKLEKRQMGECSWDTINLTLWPRIMTLQRSLHTYIQVSFSPFPTP